ncbi:condensation domain-containing protein [Streptomyces arboris]|uniref:condensation domain-containing protein n=1 Tax=Streptomyces arboris TaxID=2600619 RepID=UPI003BF6120F
MEQGASAYTVPLPVLFRGPLDSDALAAALSGVVARHEALRTRFTERDGEVYQVIGPAARVPLPLPGANRILAGLFQTLSRGT